MYDDLREGFTEYLRYERKLSENTIAAYERDVDQYLRWLDKEGIALPEVDKVVARSWLFRLSREKLSKNSLSRKISCIKRFYAYLIEIHAVQVNPFQTIHSPKKDKPLPKVIKEVDMEDFFSQLYKKDDPLSQRDQVLFELLYGSGMRVSEVCAVDISDVESGAHMRVIGKGNKERIVPLSRKTQEILARYLAAGGGRALLAESQGRAGKICAAIEPHGRATDAARCDLHH